MTGHAQRPSPSRRVAQQSEAWYRVIKFLLQIIFRVYVRRFRAYGAENVPAQGAAFLVANHTSGVDPLLMGLAIPQRMLMGPGKVEIFINPVFNYVMQKIGIFPLRQNVADAAAVRTMVTAYRQGGLVVVYPEGGRSKTGQMIPFVEDFTRLVLRLRAPIVPAGIAGARDLIPPGHWLPRPNTACAVVFGEPLDLSAFYDRPLDGETLREATAVLWNRVHELAGEAEGRRRELEPGMSRAPTP
jgi:1-acyl-sn-glycerol-3-phosphate acyltransferase